MTDWNTIKQHLVNNDKAFVTLIEQYGESTFLHPSSLDPDLFDQLIRSIISQQLSTKVATTLRNRLYAHLSTTKFTPSALIQVPLEAIRYCGLSGAKSNSIQSIASVLYKHPTYLSDLSDKNEDEITAKLISLKGVGIWTAQMFQMSALKRLDVFAPGDAGLIKGIRIVYFKGKPITETAVAKITNKWKPYRSIGSWYMWQVANTQKLQ